MDKQKGEISINQAECRGGRGDISPSLFGLYRRRIKRREAHLLTLVFDPKGGMARIRGLEAGGGSGV